jgi:cbb3-type cytochrome oxidase subunit 1
MENDFGIGNLFGRRFIMLSLIYFIIGTLWMGPLNTLMPGPSSGLAGSVYDTAHWHVVFVGFIAFFIIGSVYYIAPRIGGRDLYSRRLASLHFWASNILFPLAVVFYVMLSIVYESVLNSPSLNTSNLPSGLLIDYIIALVIMFVGIGFQGLLAYNIFMTVRIKPVTEHA